MRDSSHWDPFTPAPLPATRTGSESQVEARHDDMSSVANRRSKRGASTGGDSDHHSVTTDSGSLQIHPTSSAPRVRPHFVPLKSEPSKREPFHMREALHTPDVTTAAATAHFPTLRDPSFAEGIDTPGALPGAAETAARVRCVALG